MKHSTLEESRKTEPCVVVIFGATGDLTGRRLVPALYNLSRQGLLTSQFATIGVARRGKSDEVFRKEMKEKVSLHSRLQPLDETLWHAFEEHLFYLQSEFEKEEGYEKLKTLLNSIDEKIGTSGNRIFYLSVQPKFFPAIIEKLHKHGLLYDVHKERKKFSRVIIEKPFGHDSSSAAQLQKDIARYLHETQTYRIDHYLGKETVQNLLVFRFANPIFESLWNARHIDHVQITVAEDLGIGTRGSFFEEEGIVRDVVQNHGMQLLSLVAMEPPSHLSPKAIRDEKVKVLQSIRRFSPRDLEQFVRGQYGPSSKDRSLVGYKQENNVSPDSQVETFMAMRLFIDNWRWAQVPFFLRAGKRLNKRSTQITIVFKSMPAFLFSTPQAEANTLDIRIQPDEGISLKIQCKVPGPSSPVQPVEMDFRYGSYFGATTLEAYERLIWDCILGDNTLFARADEVEESWELLTPLLKYWAQTPPSSFPNYEAGSLGPKEADTFIEKEGRAWRKL